MSRRSLCFRQLVMLVLATLSSSLAMAAADLTVFAAASLREALEAQIVAYRARGGQTIEVAYAGSNVLARQIEAGAPADIFISADLEWMDYLESRGRLTPGTRTDLLRNELVLIAGRDAPSGLRIAPGFPLAEALGANRLAMANPDAVPAGRYGRSALQALGVWSRVEDRIARAENVRAALTLVARGEAPFGIVYRTDALAEKNVRVIDVFPESTHAPIVYPLALTAQARLVPARAFAAFLSSAEARPTWLRFGFRLAE